MSAAPRANTPQFGLTLSSEEHAPAHLVRAATAAEAAGFDFVSISDHYHPWIGEQGHSPFVWSVLGAISSATDEIDVAIGVTCPTVRIHPAVVAQAVATTACLFDGRFTWGVGTGEALNEHIVGERWPPAPVRLEMLDEALAIVRALFEGDSVTHYGTYYTVEDATVFDLPDTAPPIVVSAFGPAAAELAAIVGDGLWVSGGSKDIIARWKDAGGSGPVYSQLSVSWDHDNDVAVERAHRIWPNTAVPGQLSQDLPTPAHFEQAVERVTADQIAAALPCGPDLDPILDAVRDALDAGVDHVYFHQIGDPLDGFVDLCEAELLPAARELATSALPGDR